MVFTFSHGQAAVERGFSVNKDVLENNMLENTIVAQRMICDSVRLELARENCVEICKLNINQEMMRFCSRAKSTYTSYLAEKKETLRKTATETKKDNIKKELEVEKKLKIKWMNSCERYRKKADELALRAEKEKKMSLVAESNASRKRALEFQEHSEEANTKIMKLESELKKM